MSSAVIALSLAVTVGVSGAVQARIVRPNSPGTIDRNRAISPELAWDNVGSTWATVNQRGNHTPFSGSTELISSDLGAIVSVVLHIVGATSAAFANDRMRTRWSAAVSDKGPWHFLPTDGARDTTSFDVTSERSWSWTDFGTIEIVVDHRKRGRVDGSYYLYEAWFEISYIPTVSVDVTVNSFPFGTLPLDTWTSPQQTQIINDGTGLEDIYGKLSIFTTGSHNWNLSPVSGGPDTVRAQWSAASASGPWNNIDAYDTDFLIVPGVAPSDTVSYWLRILTPTSTGSYAEHTSTLTVSAVEG